MKRNKVLVVDDQQLFLDAVVFEFDTLGFQTLAATNGRDALKLFKNEKVDLIVSDIRMPICDGKQFLSEIRKISAVHPPFIFMTGFADLKPMEAYAMGADGFLGKPLNEKTLHQLLAKVMMPLEKRWSAPFAGSPSLVLKREFQGLGTSGRNAELQLGRGGMFINSSTGLLTESMHTDQILGIEFSFRSGPIKNLEGVGTIRWIRHSDDEGLMAGLGVEFEFLNEKCRSDVVKVIEGLELISMLPMGALKMAG